MTAALPGVEPRYVTTAAGQVRLHLAGHGPTVVALAGPTRAAAHVAAQLAGALPDRRVVVAETPGVGGSARLRAADLDQAGAALADALAWLDPGGGGGRVDLVAIELACAYAAPVAARLRPATTVLAGLDDVRSWIRTGVALPDLTPTTDGSHLLALWTFLRDRRLLRADDPTLARTTGDTPPDVDELADGFVAAATDPSALATWWQRATDALVGTASPVHGAVGVDGLSAAARELTARPAATGAADATPPATTPDTEGRVWHQYVATALGRAHLRRVGGEGRPVLVLSTGGGSSEQFAPVVAGLGDGLDGPRCVASLDYPGNGLSEPGKDRPDVADLAQHALAVVDALGWDELDVWGSHTGACVALEMAIAEPDRIGRLVLEAPPMVSPEFRDDLLAHYFPDLAPDRSGSHLAQAWAWRRDAFLFWPWYAVSHASARGLGLPSPDELQHYAVGILESGATYDGAYRAAFSYDTRGRLPLLRRPAILVAGPHDMLANTLDDAADLVPDGLLEIVPTPATVWWPDPEPAAAESTMRTYREFLR